MLEANKLFDKLLDDARGMHVAKWGEVVEFDSSNMTATIQPLPKDDYELILNIPVMTFKTKNFFIYNPLEEGDKVLLLFFDYDIDGFLAGEGGLSPGRQHDLMDSIAIGGLHSMNDKFDVADSEALTISNADNSAFISISNDGDIEIKGKNIKLVADRIDLN